jgi:hypothetical protein
MQQDSLDYSFAILLARTSYRCSTVRLELPRLPTSYSALRSTPWLITAAADTRTTLETHIHGFQVLPKRPLWQRHDLRCNRPTRKESLLNPMPENDHSKGHGTVVYHICVAYTWPSRYYRFRPWTPVYIGILERVLPHLRS